MRKQLPRELLSAAIVLYFGYALCMHYSDSLEQLVKDGFMIVVGYWLGSSKGSSDKSDQLAVTQNPA